MLSLLRGVCVCVCVCVCRLLTPYVDIRIQQWIMIPISNIASNVLRGHEHILLLRHHHLRNLDDAEFFPLCMAAGCSPDTNKQTK